MAVSAQPFGVDSIRRGEVHLLPPGSFRAAEPPVDACAASHLCSATRCISADGVAHGSWKGRIALQGARTGSLFLLQARTPGQPLLLDVPWELIAARPDVELRSLRRGPRSRGVDRLTHTQPDARPATRPARPFPSPFPSP